MILDTVYTLIFFTNIHFCHLSERTWLFIVEAEEVGHEGEDEAEADVEGRDEGGEEVVVETDDRLPVEDVEVLNELPDRHLGDHDDERYSADEHGHVADGHRQRREAVVDEVGDPGGQADDYLHPAQVGQELVDQGPVEQVGAESLVPDDAVEQHRADQGDDHVEGQVDHFDAVPF